MAQQPLKPPAIDPTAVTAVHGSNYPAQFKPRVAGRSKRRLGDALGLKNFGVKPNGSDVTISRQETSKAYFSRL
jgi:hypothetical protein